MYTVCRRYRVIRTQIQLSDDQARGLKRLAAQRGVSMAELIREGAERVLAESDVDERWKRASELIGRYHDPAPDVSSHHDRLAEEAHLP
jgi:hypothetical protein